MTHGAKKAWRYRTAAAAPTQAPAGPVLRQRGAEGSPHLVRLPAPHWEHNTGPGGGIKPFPMAGGEAKAAAQDGAHGGAHSARAEQQDQSSQSPATDIGTL